MLSSNLNHIDKENEKIMQTFKYRNGIYKGQWVMGAFTGKGKITYLNGETYDGEFMNGKLIK